jgi:NFU1 iron-sulfur cluster scaffold homolog, mitochondrial
MVEIRYQPTPNPNAGKFVIGASLVDSATARTFSNSAQAEAHPIARALFAVDGVQGVFMVSDFVTITRRPDVAWDILVPRIEAAIRAAAEQ